MLGIGLGAWAVTVAAIRLLMKSEHAFVIGALAVLLVAIMASGAYVQHLGSCGTCV